jgi:D-tagatose-1,6-bisphosphate aldolase subunit GatZ/KbaZ
MSALSITKAMAAVEILRECGERFTLIGIGPMSGECIEAALAIAGQRHFPIMLIASRNQVDGDEFGHGYVCGFDQKRFVAETRRIASAIGFDGLAYFCRDHGGPWQRDEERRAALDTGTAMALAKKSYLEDMESGFDLLHIDPTKDPHITGTLDLDIVLDRTIELISYLEKERKLRSLPPVAYEVGTEETNGGLTSAVAFAGFIEKLLSELSRRGLPKPLFVVGQTGTLVRLTENVGHFDAEAARELSGIAGSHGVGIKEHNADYLPDSALLGHPHWGVTAANIAPEFGVVQTRAYLELAELEAWEYAAEKRSGIAEAIRDESIRSGRWRKWMLGDAAAMADAQVASDPAMSARVTDICGHYTFETPAVRQAYGLLCENMAALGIDARAYAVKKIMDSIDRYAYCLGLYGLTEKLRKAGAVE